MALEKSKSKKYLNYLNNYRGFAMILIVAVHSNYLIADSSPTTYKILEFLLLDVVMPFVFIAGFLFQYLLDKYQYKTYLIRRFKFVVLPYIVMSLPAVAGILVQSPWFTSSWIVTDTFLAKPKIIQVVLLYATGAHLTPLWFIPMIVLYYIAAPLFYWIDKNPKIYFIIPLLIVVAIFVGRPMQNDNPFQLALFFLPLYLLGMMTSHYLDTILRYLLKYWYILVALTLFMTVIEWYWITADYLLKTLLTFLTLIIFYKISSVQIDKIIGFVALYSFGIYFIHKYVINLFSYMYSKFAFGDFLTLGLLGYLITLSLIVIVCILLLIPVKLVFKKHSRMLIGS